MVNKYGLRGVVVVGRRKKRGGDGGKGGRGVPDQVPPQTPDHQTLPNLSPIVNPNKKSGWRGEGVGEEGTTVWSALCCCQSRICDDACA